MVSVTMCTCYVSYVSRQVVLRLMLAMFTCNVSYMFIGRCCHDYYVYVLCFICLSAGGVMSDLFNLYIIYIINKAWFLCLCVATMQ